MAEKRAYKAVAEASEHKENEKIRRKAGKVRPDCYRAVYPSDRCFRT